MCSLNGVLTKTIKNKIEKNYKICTPFKSAVLLIIIYACYSLLASITANHFRLSINKSNFLECTESAYNKEW